MIRIGRYRVAFGRTSWLQTRAPTTVRRFLCFWIFEEAKSQDIDKKQQPSFGALLEQEGRRYRYWRACEELRKDSSSMNQSDSVGDRDE